MRWPITALHDLRRRGLARVLIPDSWCHRQTESVAPIQETKRMPARFRAAAPAGFEGQSTGRLLGESTSADVRPRRPWRRQRIASPEAVNDPRVEPVVLLHGQAGHALSVAGYGRGQRAQPSPLRGWAGDPGGDDGGRRCCRPECRRLPGFIGPSIEPAAPPFVPSIRTESSSSRADGSTVRSSASAFPCWCWQFFSAVNLRIHHSNRQSRSMA